MIHLPILLAPVGSAVMVGWWMSSVARRGKLLNQASSFLESVRTISAGSLYGPRQIIQHKTFESLVSGNVYRQQVCFAAKQFPGDELRLAISIACPMKARVELAALSLLLPTIRVANTDLRSGHLMWWQRFFHAEPAAAEFIEQLFNSYGLLELELGVQLQPKSGQRFMTVTLPAPVDEQLPSNFEDLMRDAVDLCELFSRCSRNAELQSF